MLELLDWYVWSGGGAYKFFFKYLDLYVWGGGGTWLKTMATLCLVRSQSYSHFRMEAYCNVWKATAALYLVRSQPYSYFRMEAYCNVWKATAALCVVRSQSFSHFRVETYCNVRNMTVALCLVRSQSYSLFRMETCNVRKATAALCLVKSQRKILNFKKIAYFIVTTGGRTYDSREQFKTATTFILLQKIIISLFPLGMFPNSILNIVLNITSKQVFCA